MKEPWWKIKNLKKMFVKTNILCIFVLVESGAK